MNGLDGKTVLITRHSGNELADLLSSHGAIVFSHPVVQIADPVDWESVDSAIRKLENFTWVAFVSASGIERFLARMRQLGLFAKLDLTRLAAIGQQTASRLNRHGLTVQLIPKRHDSHGLVQAFLEQPIAGSVLLVRGDRRSEVLAAGLSKAKIPFQEVVAYRSIEIGKSEPQMLTRLQRNEIDWIPITSSAIAEATVKLWGDLLRAAKLVSIGPATTAKLEALGFPPTTQAKIFDFSGIVQAMIEYNPADQV